MRCVTHATGKTAILSSVIVNICYMYVCMYVCTYTRRALYHFERLLYSYVLRRYAHKKKKTLARLDTVRISVNVNIRVAISVAISVTIIPQ